jgi:hypothetical protein
MHRVKPGFIFMDCAEGIGEALEPHQTLQMGLRVRELG